MDSTDQDSIYQLGFDFGQEASPAKTCPLPDNVQDWLEAEALSGSSSIDFLQAASQSGWLSKTSLAYSVPMQGKTLQSCLEGLPESYQKFLQTAGEMLGSQGGRSTQSPIAYSMRSFMEYPSDAAVCSLSAVLETDVPRKYFLSAKAARGILRRAERRGKALPEMLDRALRQLAGDGGEKDCQPKPPGSGETAGTEL